MTKNTTPCAFIIGEALIDSVHGNDGTVTDHPGGSPANVALTLGRLGRDPELLSWFGQDAGGAKIEQWLAASNVRVAPGSNGAPYTSVAQATLAADGSASYEFHLDPSMPAHAEVPVGAVVAHTGSIAAVLAPGGAQVLDLLKSAQATATITYDPNARPSLMGDPGEARGIIESYVRLCDVVKVSDEDLAWLYPDQDPRAVAQEWLAWGPALVVVTLGEAGSLGYTAAGVVETPVPRVDVVDTVGAGDSYMGALIHGLWEEGLLGAENRSNLKNVAPSVLTRVLHQCASVAAITVSRAGANPPWLRELSAE